MVSSPCSLPELLPQFLERHWDRLLAGEVISVHRSQIEHPAERFEWFQGSGEPDSFGGQRFVMRLRDGSRIRATVGRDKVRFVRDRIDPSAGVGALMRYAWHESPLARGARALVGRRHRASAA